MFERCDGDDSTCVAVFCVIISVSRPNSEYCAECEQPEPVLRYRCETESLYPSLSLSHIEEGHNCRHTWNVISNPFLIAIMATFPPIIHIYIYTATSLVYSTIGVLVCCALDIAYYHSIYIYVPIPPHVLAFCVHVDVCARSCDLKPSDVWTKPIKGYMLTRSGLNTKWMDAADWAGWELGGGFWTLANSFGLKPDESDICLPSGSNSLDYYELSITSCILP